MPTPPVCIPILTWGDVVARAQSLGRPLKSLLALAAKNDPWRSGHPTLRAEGKWFARLWRAMGCPPGTHLRRMHYRAISQRRPPKLPNGTPYHNTHAAWGKLTETSKPARYLGLVDPAHIVDRRNPAPALNLVDDLLPEVVIKADEARPLLAASLDPPQLALSGDAQSGGAFHLEIWVEKSTIDDIVQPLGLRRGVDVCTFIGEVSLSACYDLVERVLASGKPACIIYVSDFDPAGMSMPVAAARKIEFAVMMAEQVGKGRAEIVLQPVLLTHEQCIAYRLPRTPIKESETRGARFEERFGEGATELDALEALHPGEIERLLTAEIERFRDPNLDDAVADAVADHEADLDAVNAAVHGRHAVALTALAEEWEALRQEVERRAAEIRDRARPLHETIAQELREEAGTLRPFAMPEPADADGWTEPLFDSHRNYLEQMDTYLAFQGRQV